MNESSDKWFLGGGDTERNINRNYRLGNLQ